jgi:hypothetical protein
MPRPAQHAHRAALDAIVERLLTVETIERAELAELAQPARPAAA